jgi:hypothetical protein
MAPVVELCYQAQGPEFNPQVVPPTKKWKNWTSETLLVRM